MRKQALTATFLALAFGPLGALAQDRAETLADIRQQLAILYGSVQSLKQELNTTGGGAQISGGTVLDRVGAIESELQRLTAKTERLEFRLNQVASDGTNQIGDLAFRLCELEDECDLAEVQDPARWGGGEATTTVAAVSDPEPASQGPQLAIGEEADYERAQEALASRDFRSAADKFAAFNQTYPGSPLAAAAKLGEGEALEGLGDVREAAKSYLAAFTTDQTGPTAPEALMRLGVALGRLGKTDEACVTLSEVAKRYPQANDAILEAASAMRNIGCS